MSGGIISKALLNIFNCFLEDVLLGHFSILPYKGKVRLKTRPTYRSISFSCIRHPFPIHLAFDLTAYVLWSQVLHV